MDRRSFIQTGLAGVAGLSVLGSGLTGLSSCGSSEAKANTPLRLSFQENTAPGSTLEQRLDYMQAHGIEGFEPGGRGLKERVPELKQALSGRNIKVSAICAGFSGFILAADKDTKAAFDSSMRSIIEAAGELGSTGVIMVPAFNRQQPCLEHNQQTRDFLCSEMYKLGEYALSCGTTVILEPLNRKEAFYLRQVADAAAICRDSGSKGVKCMGDFWHMQEECSDYAAFMAAGSEYLQHVHVASRARRAMPGEDGEADNYLDGMRALKQIGYQHYISFECSPKGDHQTCLEAAIALLREQWAKA